MSKPETISEQRCLLLTNPAVAGSLAGFDKWLDGQPGHVTQKGHYHGFYETATSGDGQSQVSVDASHYLDRPKGVVAECNIASVYLRSQMDGGSNRYNATHTLRADGIGALSTIVATTSSTAVATVGKDGFVCGSHWEGYPVRDETFLTDHCQLAAFLDEIKKAAGERLKSIKDMKGTAASEPEG